MEMEGFEELNAMKDRHTGRQFEMAARHVDEHHTEKEFLRSSHESSKLQKLELSNAKELKALQTEHRIILRQLRIKQDQQIASLGGIGGGHTSGNSSKTQSGASSGFHSLIGSKTNSGVNSRHLSRGGSNEMIDVAAKGHQERNLGMKITMELAEAENDNSSEVVVRSSKTSSAALIALVKRHHAEKSNFEQQIQQEVNDFELSQEAKLAELEERQELEIRNLSGDQQTEITILKASQEKEIVMEEAMHDTEMKALLERKILNSVLETVADGIINISPDGTLIRFNKAAETIFGYTSSEVIGKNIKMLMPKRYSDDHDQYLSNYLNTGVKKVIGIPNGRRVFGLRKDGREFHLQLAVSELRTDDNHMFTGIARDLTEEVY